MDDGGVGWELYGVLPSEFATERAALVKQARAAGDRALAKEIQSLRKPTLAAWLVNQLMREQADAMGLLLELGDEMRAGLSGLAAEELRELTKRRYQLIAALIEQARSLAIAAGLRMSDAVSAEVRATLEATLADPESAEEVRAGCLAGSLHVSSFGFGAGPTSRPAPPEQEDNDADVADLSERRERRQREIERAQAAVDAAEAAAAKASKSAKKAGKRLASAVEQHEAATDDVARLQEQLQAATVTVEELDAMLHKRRDSVEEAESEYEEAAQALEDARSDLRRLKR